MIQETIAAVASGLTQSGIGIVRISGPSALHVADSVFQGRKALSDAPTYTIHYGYIYDSLSENKKIDEVLVMVMRAPRSYTGEDVAEIQCHGGPFIMERILDTVLTHGARLAEPGEFTKRAFLNGRLDLSQAEAVMELIDSQNEYARRASLDQLQGSIGSEIRDMRDKILYEVAFLEAAMDDPEHISTEGFRERLGDLVELLIGRIRDMIRRSEDGRVIAEGIRTVIVGRPNVGKSSILNLLLGQQRAIVTDVPGTTRDVLEETLRLKNLTLRLTDTAGIRDTEDQVEKIGVSIAEAKAAAADLILYVVDGSKAYSQEEETVLALLGDRKCIVLLNKSDLPSAVTKEEIEEKTGRAAVAFSARTGEGREALEQRILQLFDMADPGADASLAVANARHREALRQAGASLQLVREAIDTGMQEDLFTIDLMDAYEALGTIIGASVSDDLVNEIFSKFCMGK